MSEQPGDETAVPGPLPAEGYVLVDVACRQCGYNLRSLPVAGRCPECAAPVEYALRGYFLKHAPPGWVRRLARGLLLLVMGMAATGLLTVAMMVAFAAVGFAAASAPGTPAFPAAGLQRTTRALAVACVPINLLLIAGVWLLTAPAPTVQAGQDSAVRPWLRRSLWLYAASTLLGLVAALAPAGLLALPARTTLLALNSPLGTAALVLTGVLGFHYLSRLMARVPRPGLVRFSRICFWGALACGSLITLGQVLLVPATAQAFKMFRTARPAPPGSAGVPAGAATTPPANPRRPAAAPRSAATRPFAAPGATLPPAFPGIALVQMAFGCAGCVGMGFYVAGFVLLVMACAALYGAAREAEQIAATPPATA